MNEYFSQYLNDADQAKITDSIFPSNHSSVLFYFHFENCCSRISKVSFHSMSLLHEEILTARELGISAVATGMAKYAEIN